MNSANAPKPLAIEPRLLGPALAGVASGVLSAALSLLGMVSGASSPALGLIFGLAPGALFGIAVLVPFRNVLSSWWPRAVGAAVLCTLAHYVAVVLAFPPLDATWIGNLAAAGAVGALIAGKGLLVVIGHPWRYRILVAMVLSGALIGPAFGIMFYLAYIPWQAVTAAPLGALLAVARRPTHSEGLAS